MAVTIKHFPGDGVDERDQHLLSTINSLSAEDWESTYGRIYKKRSDRHDGTHSPAGDDPEDVPRHQK